MTSAGNRRTGLLSVKVIRGHCAAPSNWLVVRDPADRHVARKGKAAGRNSLEKYQNATYAQLYHIESYRSIYHHISYFNIHLLLYYTTKLGVHQGSRVLTHSPWFFWHGETVSSNQTLPFSCIVCRRDLWVTQRNVKRPLSIAQCQWWWTPGCWRMNRPYMKNDSWLSSFCVYPRLEAEHSWDSIAGSKPTANKTEDRLAMVNAFQLLVCKKKVWQFGTFQFFAWWHHMTPTAGSLPMAWLVMIRVIWRIKDWTSFNLPRTPAVAARIKATASSESNIVPEELAQGEQSPSLCWKFSKLVVFGCIFGNQVNK